jgi:glucose-1-phosphate thymidylyltransferase
MRIIIPMAGMGKRLRPHTLTVPKPLISIAGKPIVEHLVEEIIKTTDGEKIEEIAFIIGNFGEEVETRLKNIASKFGAEGKIYYQHQPLGTAHAINCAAPSLKGKIIVAFADTLFKTHFKIDDNVDGSIWVKKIDDPSAFGVVTVDENNIITGFVEKPKDFVSDLAIIGIYYFKEGEKLAEELDYLIKNDIKGNGEYQLTDALKFMADKGMKFKAQEVEFWFDCGNKEATVDTNRNILKLKGENYVSDSAKLRNSVIISPCYIGDNVEIENSIIGPYATIGKNSKITKSIIENSIIQNDTEIEACQLTGSMIGAHAKIKGKYSDLSLSDYSNVNL